MIECRAPLPNGWDFDLWTVLIKVCMQSMRKIQKFVCSELQWKANVGIPQQSRWKGGQQEVYKDLQKYLLVIIVM